MRLIRNWRELGLVTAVTLAFASGVHAQTVGFDVDFSGDTEGSEPVVNPNVPPYPGTHPTAVGWFDGVSFGNHLGSTTGLTHTVEDVAGLDNALVMTADTATPGDVNYVDFQFNTAPTGQIGVLEFDLAMLAAPGGDNTGYRSDWEVLVFTQGGNTATGIYASHNSPGTLAVRAAAGDITLGNYTIGEADAIRVEFDLLGGTFDAYFNGALAASDVPYATGFAGPTDVPLEFFVQQPVASGGLNQAAFDNFSYTVLVPEPTSLGLATVAGLLLLKRRRAA